MTLTLPHLQKIVAQHFQMSVERMLTGPRIQPVVEARQVAMYLCRTVLEASYPTIGRAFARNHTTVIQSVRTCERHMLTDETLRQRVETLRAAMAGESPLPQMLQTCPTCHQTLLTLVEKHKVATTLEMIATMAADQAKALRS